MTSTTTGRNALRSEIHLSWDGSDPFGSAISPAFAICDVLHWSGGDVPAECEYSPSAIEPSFEDHPDAMFLKMFEDDLITHDDLAYWARVLSRFLRILPEDRKY